MTLEEISTATGSDEELQEIIKWLPYPPRRWPKTLSRYFKLSECLTTDGNVLMKDQRIVIPRILQNRILQIAHEPHLGISAMKRRLRSKVWWTRMDTMIENFVQSCTGCTLVSVPDTLPLTRIEMPNGPWQKIAADFMEIPGGHHLLVITDYYSRYVEVAIQTSMTATVTITKMREIFARFGYPVEIVCDNGQPFSSAEFSNFCERNAISINHTVPYAAFQNGLVERQNRTLLKTLKISCTMGRNWRNDLQDFLHSYRATPHSTTKFSPSELLFGWNIRDKLPGHSRSVNSKEAKENDKKSKEKGRIYADSKRKAKQINIDVGDYVVVKNFIKKNKLTTTFNPEPHLVIQRDGSRLHLKNIHSGVISNRHVNHTKQILNANPLLNKDDETGK